MHAGLCASLMRRQEKPSSEHADSHHIAFDLRPLDLLRTASNADPTYSQRQIPPPVAPDLDGVRVVTQLLLTAFLKSRPSDTLCPRMALNRYANF